MVIGLIIGTLLGYYLPTLAYDIFNSKYDRTAFDA
jgi:hypothetical protein